jgi:hypothetical protein
MPLSIPDQTIASQVKVPDMLTTLGGIMNIKNAQQANRAYQISNDANEANLKEKTAIRDLVSDPSVRNPDGSLNQEKFTARAQVVAPTLGAGIAQGNLGNQASQIANQGSKFALQKDYMGTALQTASGLLQDPRISAPPEKYNDQSAAQALSEGFDQMLAKGVPKDQALLAVAPYMNAVHQPGAVKQMLANTLQGQMSAQGQVSASQPTMLDNGQQHININPFASQPPIQKQLPPTTQVIGENNTPGYLGPQGAEESRTSGLDLSKLSDMQKQFLMKKDPQAFVNGVQDFQATSQRPQQGNGFVASGLPAGAPQAIVGTQEQINKHWSDTQASANTAQQDIGVLQNIKQHAAGAATGVGSDRRALIDGIAGLLGMDAGQMAKTDADLLAKNSNMLALAGGDTNLARTMAEAATPNHHMTKEAITQAADQVIAQRKLALARAQFLTPFKAMADQGHPEMYNSALNQFNSVADPKVIQFSSMTPEERSSMKTAMTPQERSEFGAKLGKARQLGIAQ